MRRASAVAAGQHQVVLTSQLLQAGLTKPTVYGLVRSGWLTRVGRGALVVGGHEPSGWQRIVAAWLLTGPSSVVSHISAAAVHRLPHLLAEGPPEVTVAGTRHFRPPGVKVHRVGSLDPRDWEEKEGVRVTTADRTLVDLAPRLPATLLARVIDEGAVQRMWTPESLQAARRRAGRRTNLAGLDRLLAGRAETAGADSDLEIRVHRALRCLGPFRAQYQLVLEGELLVLDMARPDLKLVVECDGWGIRRRSRGKFDRDRRQGNLLVAHGWAVVRLTSAMSDDEMREAVVKVMLLRAAGAGRGFDG